MVTLTYSYTTFSVTVDRHFRFVRESSHNALVVGSTKAVLPLRVWVLVMALATSDAAHRCVWVVALWGVLRGVGLAHGVAITPVLLLFRELNTVTVYDKAAIKVDQEGDAGRNNEGNTALIENRRTLT